MGLQISLGLAQAMAAISGGGGAADATFGALTLAGAGGVAVPAGATALTDPGGTNLTVSGGMVVPASNGVTSGTIVFNDGGATEWVVTATAGAYSVADSTELIAAMDAADLAATRTFIHRDGADGSPTYGVIDATGYAVTGRWTIQPETTLGAYMSGINLSGSDNITLDGFHVQRYWNGEVITTEWFCVEVEGSDGIIVENCELDCDPLTTYGGWAAAPTKGMGHGVGTPAATGCTNLIMRNNYVHNVKRAFRATNASNVEISGNTFFRHYQSFWEFQGDDLLVENNDGYGLWAHGGGLAIPGPNNSYTPNGVDYPYDWGDSHSGLFGTGTGGSRHTIRNNRLNSGTDRFDTLGDYQSSASGGKFNDPAGGTTDVVYFDIIMENNIFMSVDNTGTQLAQIRGGRYVNNTHAIVSDAILDTQPNLNTLTLEDFEVSHNIACAFVTLTSGAASMIFDEDFLNKSWNNVIAHAAGQASTVSGDSMCYDELFVGPFVGLDTGDKMSAAFTPLPGTRLNSGPRIIGGVGYHNWSTGVTTAYPAGTKPKTATVNGVLLDRVDFPAAVYARAATLPVLTGDTNGFTMIFAGEFNALDDGVDAYIAQDNENAFVLRRLPMISNTNTGGRIEFYLRDASDASNVSIQSSLPVLGSDGFKVVVVSVNMATYTAQMLIGPHLDPFPRVSQFRGNAIGTTGFRHDFMPSAVRCSVERFLMIDKFLDLTDQTVLNSLVALDGLAPSYGADGSTPFGETPPVYLTGDETAWNAGGGLNLGDDATNYILAGGSVTDTVLAEPDQIGSGDWSVANEKSGGTVTVLISTAPADNGASISAYEYQVDGGTWTDSGYGFTGPITFDIDGLTDDVEVDVAVRAVNIVGDGTASATKAVTPTTVVAPTAFGIGDWSVADAGTGGTLTVTISSLPANGGDPLESIEYRIDGGAWVDIGGVITDDYPVAGLTDTVEVDIELRQSNSLFASAASDTKAATPTTSVNLVGDPTFLNDAAWDQAAEWTFPGGGSGAVCNHTTGTFKVCYSNIAHLVPVVAGTEYTISLEVLTKTTQSGTFKLFAYPHNGTSFTPAATLVFQRTSGTMEAPGGVMSGTWTAPAGTTGLRFYMESTTATLVASFTNATVIPT